MGENFTPTPGSFMDRVDKAGGIEAYKLEQAKKFVEEASKIKPKQWKAMTETIGAFADFIDSGVSGGISDITQDLKDTLSLTIEDALSPLANEVEQALAEALAPIMPEIQAFTSEMGQWFAISIGSWKSIITGDWDAVLQDISDKMPDWFKQFKNDFNKFLYESSQERISDFEQWRQDMDAFFGNVVAGWSGFWRDLGWQE